MNTPILTGFCNPTNDADSHARCTGGPTGHPCRCGCHHDSSPAPADDSLRGGAGEAPGFVHDLDEATYHSDKGSLSVSGAKVLLRSPAHFRWQQDHPIHRDVFDFGSAAHKLVLGVGDPIEVIDAESWRTKAAQEARDAARARHAIPLLAADYQRVQEMADVLSSHTLAMQLLSDGQAEVSAYCVDPETGVTRRGRFDWLGERILVDYKSAATSEPAAFMKAAINFGYHQQAAWYLDLAADLGHPAEAFAFIVQEKDAPYIVTVIELPPALVDIGRRKNRRALDLYAACTATDEWPGYVPDTDFATPDAPAWALREDVA